MEYFDIKTYHTTIDYLRSRLPLELHQVKVGIICGSGLGGLVNCFDSESNMTAVLIIILLGVLLYHYGT